MRIPLDSRVPGNVTQLDRTRLLIIAQGRIHPQSKMHAYLAKLSRDRLIERLTRSSPN